MSNMIAPASADAPVRAPRRNRKVRFALRYLRLNPAALTGFVIVAICLFLAVFGEAIVPYGPMTAQPRLALLPPSLEHPFGTDNVGMDVSSLVLVAPRIDITIALGGTLIAFLLGCPLGVFLGFYKNIVSEFVMRLLDFVQSFPIFILAMALVSFTGQNILNVIYVIGLLNLPIFARLVRAETLGLSGREFIEAARCAGSTDLKIIWRHLLPNAIAPALVQSSVTIGWSVLLTAGLSFIGAGVKVPEAEWGLMVSQGSRYMITGEWWIALFPGIAIGITVIGFALIGDAFRDILDPTRQR